jgi:hypothetical protein
MNELEEINKHLEKIQNEQENQGNLVVKNPPLKKSVKKFRIM